MRGDYVIVRSYGDKPVVLRVVDEGGAVVYVCNPERYDRLIADTDRLPASSRKREDVYCYSDEALAFIEANYMQGDAAWNQLSLYWKRETA
jgi:hypothetical protein